MLYHVYELNHAAVAPLRAAARETRRMMSHPLNPWTYTGVGRTVSAAAKLFEDTTRRYGKPEFGLPETTVDGEPVPIAEECVWHKPFGTLLHFRKDWPVDPVEQPKVLIVAPMSGHYATLLRGTVEAMLPAHDVYITDWEDARMVPTSAGRFDLNDFIDYVIEMLEHLGEGTHVMAVCQPGPAVLAAVSVMSEAGNPATPRSMTIMGSPIDTRRSPTEPNVLAEQRPLQWFKDNMISSVPWPHPGAGRHVYPGFVQLTSFMAMNRDRHVQAHADYFNNLVKGDGDSVDKHRTFYDEYLAVMDMTEEFYLQTVDEVFQRHSLPNGDFMHRGKPVDPSVIRNTGLFTVEGELDDISGIGQTQAAHDLCTGIPEDMQQDYVQPGVGHYGVFNGRRWQSDIQPRVADFIRRMDKKAGAKT